MTLVHVAALMLAVQQPAAPAPGRPPIQLPARVSGNVSMSGEAYGVSGTQARRPGQSWRMSLSPQLTLLNSFSIGINAMVSSEGSDLRQNISQLGLNPRYKWVTLHLGDFSQSYSNYTLQGTRLRGAGVDLRPGWLRFSIQGGQSQRTVAAGAAGLVYKRSLYAALVGVGREGGNFVDLMVVKAKDDVSSLAAALADTTLLDTIPEALRPRVETRPQENLVLGLQGQIGLFARRLVVKTEAAGALITKDLESPAANPAGVSGGGTASGVMPLHLSTSADLAYRIDVDANLGKGSIRGGYEYVGAGYTSLGLSYLINDRRAFNLAGNVRLVQGKLNLQAQYQHQNDNLLGQKIATTGRDAIVGSLAFLMGRAFSTTVTAMVNSIANDAAVDTFRVSNHSFALTTSSSVGTSMLGRQSTLSLSYALQRSSDDNVITRVPQVTVHNLSTAVQVSLSKMISVSPSVSFAVTQNSAAPTQSNVYAGFRGQGRFGAVRASLSATQTWSGGRGVFAVSGQGNYTLPFEGRLTLQLRHTRYDAIGARPKFQESFATLSLSRSF
jgi:hypothetical protein